MTSLLTSRGLDRLSVWSVWGHNAVDDYAKRWSNSDKKCRRRSTLKVVTSRLMTSYRLWRHSVTWRHRWGHHSTAADHFPI